MTSAQRERLGAHVRRRRRQLGLTVVEAARHSEISRTTWDALESGTRQTRDSNYALVEQTLRWQPGSIEAILDGGEPKSINDVRAAPDEDQYLDPVTGETYSDDDEREIWSLRKVAEEDRRELIFIRRARKAARAAEHGQQRRRAG